MVKYVVLLTVNIHEVLLMANRDDISLTVHQNWGIDDG